MVVNSPGRFESPRASRPGGFQVLESLARRHSNQELVQSGSTLSDGRKSENVPILCPNEGDTVDVMERDPVSAGYSTGEIEPTKFSRTNQEWKRRERSAL
jgi:hypothetical protein